MGFDERKHLGVHGLHLGVHGLQLAANVERAGGGLEVRSKLENNHLKLELCFNLKQKAQDARAHFRKPSFSTVEKGMCCDVKKLQRSTVEKTKL